MHMLASVVWTQWMGVGVVLIVIPAVLTLIAMYFRKVVKPQYPPRNAPRD